jgi:hypothetical protein
MVVKIKFRNNDLIIAEVSIIEFIKKENKLTVNEIDDPKYFVVDLKKVEYVSIIAYGSEEKII